MVKCMYILVLCLIVIVMVVHFDGNLQQKRGMAVLKDLYTHISQLEEKVKRLEHQKGHGIKATPAFSVQSLLPQIPQGTETVKFDEILSNNGGHFDNTSSVFVAPVQGYYFFVCSTMSKDDIQTEIVLNGNTTLAKMFTGTHDDDFNQGVNTAVVLLDVNDRVWVRRIFGYTGALAGDGWTTFTGFLIAYPQE